MKIKNLRNKTIPFSSVEQGEVFIVHDEDIYMKIESTYADDSGYFENAVELYTGGLQFFQPEFMVCPLDCELVIK